MAQDKYLESLEKILLLTERQLNVSYLVSAYLTIGYEIMGVDEKNNLFTLINPSSKNHSIVILSCDARRSGVQKDQFITLMKDIKEYYSNLSDKMSLNFTGRAYAMAEANKNNHKKLAEDLRKYCPDFDIEKVARSIANMNKIKNPNCVAYRILDQLKIALVDKNMNVENIFNHRVEGRPTVNKSNVDGLWTIILNGVPSICSARTEEEAMAKALDIYKRNKVNDHKIEEAKNKPRKMWYGDTMGEGLGDNNIDPGFNRFEPDSKINGKKIDPGFTQEPELIKGSDGNSYLIDSYEGNIVGVNGSDKKVPKREENNLNTFDFLKSFKVPKIEKNDGKDSK